MFLYRKRAAGNPDSPTFCTGGFAAGTIPSPAHPAEPSAQPASSTRREASCFHWLHCYEQTHRVRSPELGVVHGIEIAYNYPIFVISERSAAMRKSVAGTVPERPSLAFVFPKSRFGVGFRVARPVRWATKDGERRIFRAASNLVLE